MEGMEYFGGDSLISSLLLSLVDELCLIDFFFFFFFFTEIHPINKNDWDFKERASSDASLFK